MEQAYVFVACGTKEHITTLEFSLRALRRRTERNIIIVTDESRNEVKINTREQIINIPVPKKYSDHQAAIILKTSLYNILPKGNLYAYLDTDVVAIGKNPDGIFEEFIGPIRFAADHCRSRKFSPYAFNCGCLEKWGKDRKKLEEALEQYDKNRKIKDDKLIKASKELLAHFSHLKKRPSKKLQTAARYFLSPRTFKLNEQFYFDKKKRTWQSTKYNQVIMYEVPVRKISRATGLRYSRWKQTWVNKQGEDIWKDECSHLAEHIKGKFSIEIKENNWQHWNGGVFLFSDEIRGFLESWEN